MRVLQTRPRPTEVEVWTEEVSDGFRWSIRVHGEDLGGGIQRTHALCLRDAWHFLAHTDDATAFYAEAGQDRGGAGAH